MVTCKVDRIVVPKTNSGRRSKVSNRNSSVVRSLDELETTSSLSRNSIYKLKIDLMFNEKRSIRCNRLDDPNGSHRTRSIIMYGRSELNSTACESIRSVSTLLQCQKNETTKIPSCTNKNKNRRISNSVQAQIEQLFTDVAKDVTCSFAVTCLGTLSLKQKVTSLQGLQKPLRELYLNQIAEKKPSSGFLDICASGLRVKSNSDKNNSDNQITPYNNIAVWSAVKFVLSEDEKSAAFLPLINDPDNVDKLTLFQPLSTSDHRCITSHLHAPIFAVVMRSTDVPKLLECHGFICKSTEDAIVIAATLYQSLLAYVNLDTHQSAKRRTPRNQHGVSCISIASSSVLMGSDNLAQPEVGVISGGHKNAFKCSVASSNEASLAGPPVPSRGGRKKRIACNYFSLNRNASGVNENTETTTEERKRKSHKTNRAPPIPKNTTASGNGGSGLNGAFIPKTRSSEAIETILIGLLGDSPIAHTDNHEKTLHHQRKNSSKLSVNCTYSDNNDNSGSGTATAEISGGSRGESAGGDILTRVAIPRSGSFLNTAGLTRYKSRAARRHSGTFGGGGGSPLGFSELFNEFRLHENLHSLDDILYAIIDADGMSFNDLKPIYKEFLLKLAVTLTKDELYQRSKNIMRRQKKTKLRRRNNFNTLKKNSQNLIGAKSLKKFFQLDKFRSCRKKLPKSSHFTKIEHVKPSLSHGYVMKSPNLHNPQIKRVATSGSDVSVLRNEYTFGGLNRNSSSGYVSCSECSYDSEECACICADRCYCTRTGHSVHKKNFFCDVKSSQNDTKLKNYSGSTFFSNPAKIAKNKNQVIKTSENDNNTPVSCKSKYKCYCYMAEEEQKKGRDYCKDEEFVNMHSDTTWCDTESCISASKCYCKTSHSNNVRNRGGNDGQWLRHSFQKSAQHTGKLGLDYELFSIGAIGKTINPHEALSVKKSVEAAAIFAHVKLNQTTDIKSFCPPLAIKNKTDDLNSNDVKNIACLKKNVSPYKRRQSDSSEQHNESQATSLSSSSSRKSYSADNLLSKLCLSDKAFGRKSCASKTVNTGGLHNFRPEKYSYKNYQLMGVMSTSLENTLGYLP